MANSTMKRRKTIELRDDQLIFQWASDCRIPHEAVDV